MSMDRGSGDKMKRLTPACILLLNALWYKYNFFKKRNRLIKNSYFYYDDKRLTQDLRLSESTIRRAKRFLKEKGYIKIKNGVSKGKATEYWMLRQLSYKRSSMDKSKGINEQVFKAYQNETPNNTNTNKNINKGVGTTTPLLRSVPTTSTEDNSKEKEWQKITKEYRQKYRVETPTLEIILEYFRRIHKTEMATCILDDVEREIMDELNYSEEKSKRADTFEQAKLLFAREAGQIREGRFPEIDKLYLARLAKSEQKGGIG